MGYHGNIQSFWQPHTKDLKMSTPEQRHKCPALGEAGKVESKIWNDQHSQYMSIRHIFINFYPSNVTKHSAIGPEAASGVIWLQNLEIPFAMVAGPFGGRFPWRTRCCDRSLVSCVSSKHPFTSEAPNLGSKHWQRFQTCGMYFRTEPTNTTKQFMTSEYACFWGNRFGKWVSLERTGNILR